MSASKTERYVLLIEDNPDDEELTLRAFRKSNIANQLEVVRDGAEALEFLFRKADEGGIERLPAVTLLDLKLPKVGGLEVLRRIRADERTRAMPVVVMTSSKEEEDVVTAYRLGTNAYVRKPVDFAEFAEAVTNLGMFWLLINELPVSVGGAGGR